MACYKPSAPLPGEKPQQWKRKQAQNNLAAKAPVSVSEGFKPRASSCTGNEGWAGKVGIKGVCCTAVSCYYSSGCCFRLKIRSALQSDKNNIYQSQDDPVSQKPTVSELYRFRSSYPGHNWLANKKHCPANLRNFTIFSSKTIKNLNSLK